MGIKSLLKFLTDQNDIIEQVNNDEIKGKRIAIDISILLYQVIIAIRNSGSDLTNNKGDVTSHILGLFNKTIFLLRKGIIPIYVFDGKPPEIKDKILKIRKDIKMKSLKKLNLATDESERIKYFKRTVSISKKQFDECKELLNCMGIPYIEAPEEADSQCAYLSKNGFVDSVLTEDMDILTFGSPDIYRHLTSHKKQPLKINLENLLNKIDLTYEQFVEFCIFLGCDYCDSIKYLKAPEIYNIYKNLKNKDKMIKYLKEKGHKTSCFDNFDDIKKYFMSTNLVNDQITNFNLKNPNLDKLEDLLVNKYGLIKFKIKNKLDFLQKNIQ